LIPINKPTLLSLHTYLHIDLLISSYKLRPSLPTSYHPHRQKMEWVDRYPSLAWKSKHFLHHWLFKRPVRMLEGLTSENYHDHAQLLVSNLDINLRHNIVHCTTGLYLSFYDKLKIPSTRECKTVPLFVSKQIMLCLLIKFCSLNLQQSCYIWQF
jgi:hypothetical protein